jgi:hypothetical protein
MINTRIPSSRHTKLAIAAVVALSLITIALRVQAQSSAPTLTVATGQANPGDSFDLPITISTTTGIRAYQFDLAFDPSRLQVNSVGDGGFLATAGGGSNPIPGIRPVIDNVNGLVTGTAWTLVSGAGFTALGQGSLAIINMTVLTGATNGEAYVNLNNVELYDVNAQRIPGVETVNGWVQVGVGGSPLAPTAGAASVATSTPLPGLRHIKVLAVDFGNGPMLPQASDVTAYPMNYNLYLLTRNQGQQAQISGSFSSGMIEDSSAARSSTR